MDSNPPTSLIIPELKEKTLVVQLPDSWNTLSWAPYNGGWKQSSCIFIHHQNKFADFELNQIFMDCVEGLGLPQDSIGLLTGAKTEHFCDVFLSADHFRVHAIATLGLSNARAAGDQADAKTSTSPGTINLIVATNALPDLEGCLEAVHTATMAKTAALMEEGIVSPQSGLLATGTGTDCIAICASGQIKENYCGMHTLLGELIGKAVKSVLQKSIHIWKSENI